MKVTIDNLDGLGPIDYSGALAASKALEVERTLNAPSLCRFGLAMTNAGLRLPLRNARVMVSCDDGTMLFTGYLPCEPVLAYAGVATVGATYEAEVAAVSDEILLNQQSIPQTAATYGQTAQTILEQLTNRVYPNGLVIAGSDATAKVGAFLPAPGESWSENAGALASMSRSAYRVLNGALSVAPIASTVHALNEADGSLEVQALQTSSVKMLANDVTLCGEKEPATYVTEIFQADGIVSSFELSEEPFFPPAARKTLLQDLFQAVTIDRQLWQVADPDVQLSLSTAGLTFQGGTGIDGQTNLSSIDQLEMGGTLVAEATGVQLSGNGDGILCGLYGGAVITTDCFAGFHVKQVSGVAQIVPVVCGVEAGPGYTPASGAMYTLRIRTYCREMQRVLAAYMSAGSNGTACFGGSSAQSAVTVVLELQDVTGGIAGPVTVLYEGVAAASPATCTFAPLNTATLLGSVRSVAVVQAGSVWATSLAPDGTAATLRLGAATEGATCRVTRTGKLEFYSTAVPPAGEQICVCYRTTRRSVARMANAASLAQEGNATIPATSRWIGSVRRPAARSSEDCENAATAVLDLSCSRLAALEGRYIGYNMQKQADVWPGDVLAVNSTSAGVNANLVVRTVKVEADSSVPEVTRYTIGFANDWAHDLAIQLSSTVPEDAWLPEQAVTSVAVLESLAQLSAGSVTGAAIQINAGVAAPNGGGFEVRRRDWSFGPGVDADLVLRSPVANFTIPRAAAVEQYFVRMYDGATPPNYSRFSAALFVNVPLQES